MNNYTCVILAAGKGKRFGFEKQYFMWKNRMLWQYAYSMATEACNNVMIVGMDIDGGNTRQESVLRALKQVKTPRVVLLDVSTPLVSEAEIEALGKSNEPSISYGRRPEASLVIENGKYIRASSAMIIQTPQGFDTELLLKAHYKTNLRDVEEDTILMKTVHGIDPVFLQAPPELRSVVYPEDLQLLEGLY